MKTNRLWRIIIAALWIWGVFKAPSEWEWLSMILTAGMLFIVYEIRFKE